MIKVSIIVPVYNVEKYISKCLDSLVNQTLNEIEIIVVNDGSLDNSQKIIDDYVKKYPDKIKSYIKENGGQGSARNYGLNKAIGEYVTFIDSDDYIDTNFAKDMYKLAKKEKSQMVICDIIEEKKNKRKYFDCTSFRNLYESTPSVCNKIFEKNLFDNIRFISKIWYEDLNVMMKINPKIKKYSVLKKGYYIYNQSDNSTMRNENSVKNLDILIAVENAKEYLKENNIFDENIYNFFVFNHILIDTINRVESHSTTEKKEVINKLNSYCRKNIANYEKQDFYADISSNRKIIAWFNYHKLHKISKLLINIKKYRRNRGNI